MYYYFKIIRPINLTTIAATLLLMHAICMPELLLNDAFFWKLTLGTLLIAAGGYVINDVCDVAIDKINKPKRLIVDKKISVRAAIRLYNALNIAALAVGVLSGNFLLIFIFFLTATLLLCYARYFKKMLLVGNLVVAFLCALVVIQYLYFYRQGIEAFWQFVLLFYTAFAFYTTLAREIVKDIEDMPGDLKLGCRTLAIHFGPKVAMQAALFCLVVVLLLLCGLVYWWFSMLNYLPIVCLFVLLIAPLLVLILLFVSRSYSNNYALLSQLLKGYMLMGLLFLIVLRMVS